MDRRMESLWLFLFFFFFNKKTLLNTISAELCLGLEKLSQGSLGRAVVVSPGETLPAPPSFPSLLPMTTQLLLDE